MLCDVVTRAIRTVLRESLRCEDSHSAGDVVRVILRQLLCLPSENVLSPDSEAGDDSSGGDEWMDVHLKVCVCACVCACV